jgi:hypothetical protein
MERLLERFNQISGGVFGIISLVIMSIMGILSYRYYPSHEFKLFLYVVSELGAGQGAIFFNGGLIISGVFLIPFFLKLNTYLTEGQSKRLREVVIILGLISSSSYLLLGFFPINIIIHMILVINIFFIGLVNIVILNVIIAKNDKFIDKFLIIFGLLYGISIFLYFFTLIFYYSIHSIFEWIMIIFFSIWLLFHSIYLIYQNIKSR